jgi:polyhydroxyalkanoate synthase
MALVRDVAACDPQLAARALRGLRAYQAAPRSPSPAGSGEAARGEAHLRHCAGAGRPIVLVPSIINPPHVLDLDPGTSLATALGPVGRVLLLDWGPLAGREHLDLSRHVRDLLVPLLSRSLPEAPLLVGYCLGGTVALAAAALTEVAGVATLAAPWHFSAYPADARAGIARLWRQTRPAAEQLGALPMEVLQAAFWSLDPQRVVAKYARFADLAPDSAEARRFVLLEDWANGGQPVPLPAAHELIEELFGRDLPGSGKWLNGLPSCPTLHFTAGNDRIVPPATASPGPTIACPAGHVGMVVGRSAPLHLHRPLREWLAAQPRGG